MVEVTKTQLVSLGDYKTFIDPSSYRVATNLRKAIWPAEKTLIGKIHADLTTKIHDLEKLQTTLDAIGRHTRQSLEIMEEDHGKAIFVFTTITIIFLPLSFVCGYLGMNTADIRNLEQTQWIFWSAAVPVTAVVVGIAVLLAYKGDEIWKLLKSLWAERRQLASKHMKPLRIQRAQKTGLAGHV